MSQFSTSFLYEAIDKVSPILDKIKENQKKVGIAVAKTQMKVNESLKDSSKAHSEHAKVVKNTSDKIIKNNKKVRDSMQKLESMKSIGNNIATKVGVPFVGATTAMIMAGGDFEESLKSLQAITGVSNKQLLQMKSSIIATSSEFNTGAVEIAKGMELIGSKQPDLLNNPDMLLNVAKASMTMGKASGMAFTETSEALTNVMNQYGLAGDQAFKVANVLSAGSKFGAVGMAKISRSMIQAGTASRMAGVSLEQTVGAIEILGERGIEGERAGTALRNVFTKLATGANKFNPKIVGLEKSLDNLSKLKPAQMLKMFGQENLIGASTLVELRKKVIDMTAKVTDTNTVFDQASIRTDHFKERLSKLWNEIKNALIPAFDALKPILTFVVNTFAKGVVIVGNFMKNNKGLTVTLFAIAGALALVGTGMTVFATGKIAVMALNKQLLATKLLTGSIGKGAGVLGALFAGWSIGKLLNELPVVQRFMDQVTTGLAEMFGPKDIELTPEQREAQKASRERMLLKRQEARATNQQKAMSLQSSMDVNINASAQNMNIDSVTTKLTGATLKGKNRAGAM